MTTDHNSDTPRRHDIKFIRQEDGTDAAVITFPPGVDHLGVDAPLLIDYFDTVIIALHTLRTGEYDIPGPETVRRLYNSIMHVDQKLLPRLNGLRNALIRAHYAAGGSHRDLSLAMDTSRETAISRGNKIRNSEPDDWERWARRELPDDTARGVKFTAPTLDPESAKAELAEIIHYMHTELDSEHSDRQYMTEQALTRLEELHNSI